MKNKIIFSIFSVLFLISIAYLNGIRGIEFKLITDNTNIEVLDTFSSQSLTDKIIYEAKPINNLTAFYLKTDTNNRSMVKVNEDKWLYDLFTNVRGIDNFCKIDNELLKMEFHQDNIILSKQQIEKFGETEVLEVAINCTKNVSYYKQHSLDWAVDAFASMAR